MITDRVDVKSVNDDDEEGKGEQKKKDSVKVLLIRS